MGDVNMRYRISCASCLYYNEVNLVRKYPCLKEFQIDRHIEGKGTKNEYHYYYIHLNSLEELNKLVKVLKFDVIVGYDTWHDDSYYEERPWMSRYELMIYDDYIE